MDTYRDSITYYSPIIGLEDVEVQGARSQSVKDPQRCTGTLENKIGRRRVFWD